MTSPADLAGQGAGKSTLDRRNPLAVGMDRVARLAMLPALGVVVWALVHFGVWAVLMRLGEVGFLVALALLIWVAIILGGLFRVPGFTYRCHRRTPDDPPAPAPVSYRLLRVIAERIGTLPPTDEGSAPATAVGDRR